MNDSVAQNKPDLRLSQPAVVDEEVHFSAFGPGWGFCSYILPASIAMQCLGARDPSASQLTLAFQLNRQRIAAVVADVDVEDRGRRVVLSAI
jgi:hypothetical protein